MQRTEWRLSVFQTRALASTARVLTALAVVVGVGCHGDEHGRRHEVPQEGGTVVDRPDFEDDKSTLSPPMVDDRLLGCGESVVVYGFVPHAEIDVYANGVRVGGGPGGSGSSATFSVSPELVVGELVTATQTFDGVTSLQSESVPVQDHHLVYPDGLPEPEFTALPLYRCGILTAVRPLPPGGTVWVWADDPADADPEVEVGRVVGCGEGQQIGINPPFELGHEVWAQGEICTDLTPETGVEIVQPPPSSLPTPSFGDLYENGELVVIYNLVQGAKVTIKSTLSGLEIGHGAGAGGPSGKLFRVDPPLVATDDVEAVQELCDVVSNPGVGTVLPCSDLPPAKLLGPRDGDTHVHLYDVTPGARVFIIASGQEIGDGGGETIQLTRPLVFGETVLTITMLGDCISQWSHQVGVGTGLDDPGESGICRVQSWEYGVPGSEGARTTDVSSYFDSPDSDVTVPMSAVPLHGIVRYPSGTGPFPLVLVVHGNHGPLDPSEPGYVYLLDHLASHCMIAVSVDENFLNGWVGGEMDARAIVLLRHLQLWREWTQDSGNDFFGKVDLSRIGLAGHSRGGEAITVAEMFNETLHDPADPAHDFNFWIRSLYAIAPVDGQHDSPVTFDADYLVMHGSHDGDVSGFSGHKTYDRAFPVTSPTPRFKTLLYIYGANHGQWNTGWGTTSEYTVDPVANRISGPDQRAFATTYMTAFFLSTLRGWHDYNDLFTRDVTFASLPAAITRVTQFQHPYRAFVDHFEEDDDLATASIPGATNNPVGPPDPYLDHPFSDQMSGYHLWEETDGLVAGWEDTTGTQFAVEANDEMRTRIAGMARLAFRVGQVYEPTPDRNTPGVDKDLTVQLVFGTVDGPELRVSDYATLPYPDVTDHPTRGDQTKTIMQSVRIPWLDLTEGLEQATAEQLTEIRFKFDRQVDGLVAIDEIQFTE